MSEDGEMTGCRPSVAAPPGNPLDNDDILGLNLLRLPSRPSSLPRASLVCKRWRRLVSDPGFFCSFRRHHRKPPLLGLLSKDRSFTPSFSLPYRHPLFLNLNSRDSNVNICFTPLLDPPDRIPAARFSLRPDVGSEFLGCRHGRVLVLNKKKLHFLVWDPITGDQRRVAFPPVFCGKERYDLNGAVICAASDQGHVHGGCHLSPFQLVMIGRGAEQMLACVYSSDTDAWGNLVSILWPPRVMIISTGYPNTLVGNSICWLITGEITAILEFDLGRQSLAIIDAPQYAFDLSAFSRGDCQLMITPADGDGLGFLVLSGFTARLWKRKVNSDGVVGWVPRNTIELNNLLPLVTWVDTPAILGLAEDDNVIFLLTDDGVVFMVHLESAVFKKLPEKMSYCLCHPFTSFYTAGMGIGGGHDGVEIVHNA